MNRAKAPLYEALLRFANEQSVSFHVPGHKHGEGFDMEAQQLYQSILKIDQTEVAYLDDLHAPSGVIQEAQQFAASCFGAEHSYFLVGGSTAGNLALILATCRRDDLMLVQRNVHQSVLNGLMLAGARAVFIPSKIDVKTGKARGICTDAVRKAVELYPEAKGLFVTSPDYYGESLPLRELANIVHEKNIPLLVDEAHGAHFGFHPDFPQSALQRGADGVVQSTHKMLTAMTMGSMLHVQGNRLPKGRLEMYLSSIQSSSPSYPIMGSLDLARRQLDVSGPLLFQNSLETVRYFRSQMSQYPFFELNDSHGNDPFKVTVTDLTKTFTGFSLLEELGRFGCYAEMADLNSVLLHFSLSSTKTDIKRLISSFWEISRKFRLNKQEMKPFITNKTSTDYPMELSNPVSFADDVHDRYQTVLIPLKEAANRFSAEMISAYPPGIPLIYRGEVITQTIIEHVYALQDTGARFHGFRQLPQLQIAVFQDE